MNKKIISLIIIFIICILIVLPSTSFGVDIGLGDLDQYKGTPTASDELVNRIGVILGVIQTVGTVLSVVMLMAIGIKYMVGSIEEKAQYKKTLIPYIIGAAILFTGSTLPQLIYNIMQNLE